MFLYAPTKSLILQAANTQPSTIAGTTESSLFAPGVGSRTIPANWFQPGYVARLIIRGSITTPLTPGTTMVRTKVNGTTISSTSTSSLLGLVTNSTFYVAVNFQCYTAGASGTMGVGGEVRYPGGLAGLQMNVAVINEANKALNTEIDNTLDVTIQHGSTQVSTTTVIQTLEAIPTSRI